MDELAREMDQARAHLGVRWSDERAADVARALERRRRLRTVRRAGAFGGAVLLLLAGGALVWRSAAVAPPLRDASDRAIRFADGSTATPLEADTVLRATGAPGRVLVEIERGSARFEVAHDPSRVFVVEAGEVRVEDLGTRFTIERIGPRARVSVENGRVAVTWATGKDDLGAGASGLYPPEPPARTPALEPAPKSAPTRRAAHARDGKTWRALAEEGDFDRAYEQMPRPGTPEFRDEPDDLLSAADVARLSHHPADAIDPLRRILRDHARDPRAQLAAFTLGRILLEELGRPREAADAFASAQTLAPAGPLASDALAREVEAWSRAGDAERARDRAEDYLRRFPDGSRVRSVRRFGGLE